MLLLSTTIRLREMALKNNSSYIKIPSFLNSKYYLSGINFQGFLISLAGERMVETYQ